jgi:steroid delta-isomerase-like uncharacterized protein
MSEDNIAVIRRMFDEVWGKGNMDAIDEVTTEGFVDHDALTGDGDREAAKRSAMTYREAFPDLQVEIVDIFASGDRVCTRWRAQGTFENELMGFQPNHERGDPVEGITIDRFEDGKIAESWNQFDSLTLMRDIGAMPAESGAAAG